MRRYHRPEHIPAIPIFLREWRENRLLSENQMAELIDLSKSSISKIERGETPYYRDLIEAYCFVLECEPSDLFAPPSKAGRALLTWQEKLSPERRQRVAKLLRDSRLGPSNRGTKRSGRD